MVKLFTEWCSRPNARAGVMLEVEKLSIMEQQRNAGFRSVYMFDEVAAKEIMAAGRSKGFDQYKVYSDILFIDLDDGKKTLPVLIDWIKEHNLKADIYSSGSKGYHAHIAIEPMEGTGVPHSQHEFVKNLPFDVDESLYRPMSIIALPGRKHEKTGRQKQLVESIDGNLLSIPYIEKPVQTINFDDFISISDCLLLTFEKAEDLILNPPNLGLRFNSMWAFAKRAAEAGLHPDTTANLLVRINERWENKKEMKEIERAIKQAYHL